jgi:hypothetical protein
MPRRGNQMILLHVIVLLRRPNSVKEARYQLKQDNKRMMRPLGYFFLALVAVAVVAEYVHDQYWH